MKRKVDVESRRKRKYSSGKKGVFSWASTQSHEESGRLDELGLKKLNAKHSVIIIQEGVGMKHIGEVWSKGQGREMGLKRKPTNG